MPTDFKHLLLVQFIDPLLTEPVLNTMYKSTKTRQRQIQKYGRNNMKFRISEEYFNTFVITRS